jgi:PKD repeat protein
MKPTARLLVLLALSGLFHNLSLVTLAQTTPVIDCPSDRLTDSLIANDPRWARSFFYMEQKIQAANALAEDERSNDLHTLPVVVHIIHNGEPTGSGTNISDAQIQSAITALNEDFRRMPGTNGFGDGVDVNIEFCLAQRDPSGNPTTGIVRVNGTSVPDYATEGITAGAGEGAGELAVKSLSTWPRTSYVNIWVVTEIENNDGGSGIQGYAYFPFNDPRDGIVILYNAFGTTGNLKSYTNMNRTLTHEVGHYLGLYHTFNDTSTCSSETNCNTQGDRVCDTPPTILSSSCSSPACGGTQQVANYLDYTSQTCQDMFTEGQKTRMRTTLETQRTSMISSLGCDAVFALDAGITAIASPNGASCNNTYTPSVTLTNFGGTTLTSVNILYNIDGTGSNTFSWTGSLVSGASISVTLPQITASMGMHTFYAWTSNPNGQTDQNASNNQATSDFEVANGGQVSLVVTLDYFGQENTWTITNSGGAQLASGGPYPNNQPNSQHTTNLCLPEGCYTLRFFDSYGDGQGFINGNFTLYDDDDNVLATASGNWGAQSAHPFCVTAAPPAGNPPVASFTVSDATVCIGQAVSFTNTSTNTPTSYSWTFAGGTPSTSTQASPSGITWNSAGTKTVTLTATNSFGTNTYTCNNCITVIAGPTVTLNTTAPTCAGTSNGQVSTTVSGGYSPYTYSWSNGASSANITNLGAGTYSVTVTNNQGCTGTASATITAPSAVSVTGTATNITCAGQNTGSITVSATGGTGSKTFSWSNGATGSTISNLAAGSYTVTATDANGCTAQQTYPISQPAGLSVAVTPVHVACDVGTGSATAVATGGTGSYAYSWSTGAGGASVSGLSAGNYSVQVTDQNGCSVSQNFTITSSAGLTVTLNSTPMSCHNSNDAGITATVNGGTAPYTYSWTTGQNNSSLNNLSAGTYTVNVTASNGCTGTASVVITNPALLDAIVFKSDISCFGANDGSAIVSVTGGTGAIEITWSNGDEGTQTGGLNSGVHTVIVSDENGCTLSESFTITEPSAINVITELVSAETCAGSDGSAIVNAMGGTGTLTYVWSNGFTGQLAENLSSGNYGVGVLDSNGCTAESGIGIPYDCIVVLPTTRLTDEFCGAQQLALDAVIECIALDNANSYQWRFGNLAGQTLAEPQTTGNSIALSTVTGIFGGETYVVHVRALIGDTWSAYGEECTIATEDIVMPFVTQLTEEDCGATITFWGEIIHADPVPGALNYEWNFTGEGYEWTSFTNENWMELNASMLFAPGSSYDVKVRCGMGNGVFTEWGSICPITFARNETLDVSYETGDQPEGGLLFFPNPFNGEQIQMNTSGLGMGDSVSPIRVTNSAGQLVEVITRSLSGGQKAMHAWTFANRLAPGMYYLTYSINGVPAQQKLMVH